MSDEVRAEPELESFYLPYEVTAHIGGLPFTLQPGTTLIGRKANLLLALDSVNKSGVTGGPVAGRFDPDYVARGYGASTGRPWGTAEVERNAQTDAAPERIEPLTRGIAPAQEGPLMVLQQTERGFGIGRPGAIHVRDGHSQAMVEAAARQLSFYHPPQGDQEWRYSRLSAALADFLTEIVDLVPAGPQRSTAISRALEAKMWGAHGIAIER